MTSCLQKTLALVHCLVTNFQSSFQDTVIIKSIRSTLIIIGQTPGPAAATLAAVVSALQAVQTEPAHALPLPMQWGP
jgi:hypothetical protein